MTICKIGFIKPLKELVDLLPWHKKDYKTSVSFLYEGKIVPGVWGEKLSYPLTEEQEKTLRNAGFEIHEIRVHNHKVEYLLEEI